MDEIVELEAFVFREAFVELEEFVVREAFVAREADREGNIRLDRFVLRETERYVLDLVYC